MVDILKSILIIPLSALIGFIIVMSLIALIFTFFKGIKHFFEIMFG